MCSLKRGDLHGNTSECTYIPCMLLHGLWNACMGVCTAMGPSYHFTRYVWRSQYGLSHNYITMFQNPTGCYKSNNFLPQNSLCKDSVASQDVMLHLQGLMKCHIDVACTVLINSQEATQKCTLATEAKQTVLCTMQYTLTSRVSLMRK